MGCVTTISSFLSFEPYLGLMKTACPLSSSVIVGWTGTPFTSTFTCEMGQVVSILLIHTFKKMQYLLLHIEGTSGAFIVITWCRTIVIVYIAFPSTHKIIVANFHLLRLHTHRSRQTCLLYIKMSECNIEAIEAGHFACMPAVSK